MSKWNPKPKSKKFKAREVNNKILKKKTSLSRNASVKQIRRNKIKRPWLLWAGGKRRNIIAKWVFERVILIVPTKLFFFHRFISKKIMKNVNKTTPINFFFSSIVSLYLLRVSMRYLESQVLIFNSYLPVFYLQKYFYQGEG